MACFEQYKCVLCFKVPSLKSDINFLDNKENIRGELESLPFSISLGKSICKACLALMNKRRSFKERLLDLDNTLTKVHQTALNNRTGKVARNLGFESTSSKPNAVCLDDCQPLSRFVTYFIYQNLPELCCTDFYNIYIIHTHIYMSQFDERFILQSKIYIQVIMQMMKISKITDLLPVGG